MNKMPAPTNKKQVQSFIGMINYLFKFSARLPDIAEPSREMAKNKVPFNWSQEHQSAFTQMKKRDWKCSHIGLLQSKEANCLAN